MKLQILHKLVGCGIKINWKVKVTVLETMFVLLISMFPCEIGTNNICLCRSCPFGFGCNHIQFNYNHAYRLLQKRWRSIRRTLWGYCQMLVCVFECHRKEVENNPGASEQSTAHWSNLVHMQETLNNRKSFLKQIIFRVCDLECSNERSILVIQKKIDQIFAFVQNLIPD